MDNPANGREMAAIDWLGVICSQTHDREADLQSRLREIPYGWRDYRLAASTLMRLLKKVICALPARQQRHVTNVLRTHEVHLRLASTAKIPGDCLMVERDAFREIINTAMAAECAICLKSEAEIRGCKLRKALETCIMLEEYPKVGCGYTDVVTNNELGKYI